MSNGWVDGFEKVVIEGKGGLRHRVAIAPRFTIHSTEGHTAESAVNEYRQRGVPPHFTLEYDAGKALQHVPVHLGSYALENDPGGVETNACANVQIEIVGFAKDGDVKTDAELVWLGRMLAAIAAEMRNVGMIGDAFDLIWPEFFDELSGFTLATKNAKQRSTFAEWYSNRWTLYGHQHIPENAHWDPGKINWVKVDAAFDAAFRPQTTPPSKPPTSGDTVIEFTQADKYKLDRAADINATQAARMTQFQLDRDRLMQENEEFRRRLDALEANQDLVSRLAEAIRQL